MYLDKTYLEGDVKLVRVVDSDDPLVGGLVLEVEVQLDGEDEDWHLAVEDGGGGGGADRAHGGDETSPNTHRVWLHSTSSISPIIEGCRGLFRAHCRVVVSVPVWGHQLAPTCAALAPSNTSFPPTPPVTIPHTQQSLSPHSSQGQDCQPGNWSQLCGERG